ncbi:MAG: Crp/Fnr family transcriptional regulator [Burkholderiaceae bacterium]|jgi:CRP/FNR family transcriptional regulator, cyclic AMP receptor protein
MAQDENKAFLKRVPLFSGLTDGQIERLAAGSVRRNFPKGRTIVAEGEPSQSLYVLLSGRAKVQRSDTEGKEVILSVLGPGECFGEMSLIDDAPRSASVITLESSDFMSIAKESFKAILASSPEICLRIMKGLVKRLRDADKKIETLALLDVYGRVARVLLDFSEEVGNDRVVKNKLPRQEIAKMIGASREMVSRVMKGLETEGYIVPMPEGKIMLREKLSNYLS